MKVKKILRMVAKRNGVSVKEVRREIQEAIDWAWMRLPEEGKADDLRLKIPCKGGIPTPEELICYVSGEIRMKGGRG